MKTAIELKDHERQELQRSKDYDPAADPIIRSSGLGGSDMATVLGMGRFKSPLQLWSEKRGTWPAQFAEDVGSKLPVRLGKKLEDDICELFAEDLGLKLNRYRQTARHDSIPWAMAHPDRKVIGKYKGKRAIVEAKFTSLVDDWGEPGTDQIAAHYLPQVHQELWLTGADLCFVPVWLCQFRIEPVYFIVERDPEWFDILEGVGEKFWNCVLTGEEPEIDYTDAPTQDALSKIYREQYKPGDVIQLDDAAQAITDSMKVHKEDIKLSKSGVDACTAKLTKLMGDAQLGRLPDGRWWRRKPVEQEAYTVAARKRVDQRIIKALPKTLDAYARSMLREQSDDVLMVTHEESFGTEPTNTLKVIDSRFNGAPD